MIADDWHRADRGGGMSPDYVCDHHRNGVPFAQSTTPHFLVCPICNPERVA